MILSIFYSILSILVLFDLYYSYKRSGINYFFIIGIYYFISLILQGFFLSIDNVEFDSHYTRIRIAQSSSSYLVFILISVFYLFFRIGYYSNNYKVPKLKTDFKLEDNAWKIELFTTCLFILSVLIYASAHGGFSGMLRDAQIFRSGYGEYSKYDFFKRFFYIGQISWMFCLHRLVKNKISIINILYSTLIFLFNMLALLSMAGRTNIILFLVISFLIICDGIISKKFIITSIVIFLIVVLFGDPLFVALKNIDDGVSITAIASDNNSSTIMNNFKNILFEFQHPYSSINAVIENYHDIHLRYGIDFIYAILNIVPEKIFFLGRFETVAYPNTQLLTGIYTSTIPPGILAFSIYSFGILGVVIMPFFFGKIISMIERLFLSKETNNFLLVSLYYITGFKLSGFILGGEPRVFLYSYFAIGLVVLVYYLLNKKIKKNVSVN